MSLGNALSGLGFALKAYDAQTQARQQQQMNQLEIARLQLENKHKQEQAQIESAGAGVDWGKALAKMQQDAPPDPSQSPYYATPFQGGDPRSSGGPAPGPQGGGGGLGGLPGAQPIPGGGMMAPGRPGMAGPGGGAPTNVLLGGIPAQGGGPLGAAMRAPGGAGGGMAPGGAAPGPQADQGGPPQPPDQYAVGLQMMQTFTANGLPPALAARAVQKQLPKVMQGLTKQWQEQNEVYKERQAEADRQAARQDRFQFHADSEADRRTQWAMHEQEHNDSMANAAATRAIAQQGKGWELFQSKDGTLVRVNKDTGEVAKVDDPNSKGVGKVGSASENSPGWSDSEKKFWSNVVKNGGSLPPGLARTKEGEALLKDIMKGVADTATPGGLLTAEASQKADRTSLTNITKMTDSAVSFERTARMNFDNALRLAPKGVPTDLGPWINKWVQDGQTALGNKHVPAYVAALLTGANEYAKIMNGSTGSQGSTVDSRREAAAMFKSAYNVDGIRNVLESVAYPDMENRKQSLDDQLNEIRGRIGGQGQQPNQPQPQAAPMAIGPGGHKVMWNGKAWVDAPGQ
jgi:hypothetical protein